MFSLSLNFSDNASLAFLTVEPIVLVHCMCNSDGDNVVSGLRICFTLMLMRIGSWVWSLAVSGCRLVIVLHSVISFANIPICLSPALEIGSLRCVGIAVSCLGGCIGHMVMAKLWYPWKIVMTCAAA